MNIQAKLKIFNEIYETTYKNTLKYVLLHCNNLDDVKDLVQDTYLDFYKFLNKKDVSRIENIDKYIIGISKNVLKKYYYSKDKKNNIISLYQKEDNEIEINSNVDIELQFISSENVKEIWEYIKCKDVKIAKIFYCYYHLDMKINEISFEMNLKESTVKNYIYRTINELQKKFKKEENENV